MRQQNCMESKVLLLQYMEITDKDDEKSKTKKKKLQKKWKSDQRFAKKDAETQKRQQSWMDFKKGKGSKKKVAPCMLHATRTQNSEALALMCALIKAFPSFCCML